MVKTPKTRHSKSRREPLTIELEPGAVSRISDDPVPAEADLPGDQQQPIADEARPAEETMAEAATATETATAAEPEGQPAASAAPEPSREAFGTTGPSATYGRAGAAGKEPPAAPRRGDGFSRVLAGVIGGVMALAAAGGLQYAGLLASPRAGSGDATVQADIDGLKQEVAALRDAGSAGAGDLAAKVDGFGTSLETVKSEILALQEKVAAETGGENTGLQALDARVKQIEASLATLDQAKPAVDAGAIAAIGDRVTAVEAAVKSAAETAAASDVKLSALEASVASLTAKVDAQAAQPKIALAISAAALKSAIDRGAPFAAELETFAAIAPQAPEIPALRALAERGVSSRDDLIADMDEAAAAMIASGRPLDRNAGFFERLLDSAESLVTVRPVGSVEGAGVPEIVARMEMALKAGNLDQAVAEYDSLPEAAKAAGGDFGERLKARQAAEKLVDQAIAAAMKA